MANYEFKLEEAMEVWREEALEEGNGKGNGKGNGEGNLQPYGKHEAQP